VEQAVTPPAGWLSDEALVAKVIAENPDAGPIKLGVLIVETLRANHRLLLPPPAAVPPARAR
jgi:hypothetical protein